VLDAPRPTCHPSPTLLPFHDGHPGLPPRFHARVPPTKVSAPRLVALNRPLAELLGADVEELASPEGLAVLAGNAIAPGSDPVALAYAGHQFGSFVPRLGDGRAILLGEVVGRDGERRDVQLKGSGRTPFSRNGDGRAALGPVLREYLVSEAMAALGIPTTRALAAVTTGERVLREEAQPGAILTRVAASHLRVGTFEYFAAREDREALEALTTYALTRHYPDAAGGENDALALLDRVIGAQADLVARWMGVGFVHGVMNTDNTSISGETIDFGPCAFLDEYSPTKRFSSIDHRGRYAFGNQPRVAVWNLARLAEALLPLIAEDEEAAARVAMERLDTFGGRFSDALARVHRAKLGLTTEEEGDVALVDDLLARMADHEVDFTLLFRRLAASAEDAAADAQTAALFAEPGAFREWAERWRQRLSREEVTPAARARAMRLASPAYIPRNHRVEAMIQAAVQREDFAPFEELGEVLRRPYDDQPERAHYADPPLPEERVTATFCGT
jgi:serine/tyrosine/threonine adenylyltransferase